MIIRFHLGCFINGIFCVFLTTSVIMAEATTLRDTLLLATNINFSKFTFESDNLGLIRAYWGKIQGRSLIWCLLGVKLKFGISIDLRISSIDCGKDTDFL